MRLFSRSIGVLSILACAGCTRPADDQSKAPAALDSAAAVAPSAAKFVSLPATFNEAAVLQAVKDAGIDKNDFVEHFGDEQDITIGGTSAHGVIMPHKGASAMDPVNKHGKVLALINVDKPISKYGWKAGDNYWIAAQFTDKPLEALMIPADLSSVTEVDMTQEKGWSHKQAFARWKVTFAKNAKTTALTTPWATCDGGTCCCPACADKDREPGDTLQDSSHIHH